MVTLDAQVHVYERDHAARPWTGGGLHGPPSVTGTDMVAAMDAVGVDGAILVSPFSMYRYDPGYMIAVHADHPERFRMVTPVDPNDPGSVETIEDWARTPGAVAIRLLLRDALSDDAADPGVRRVVSAAARCSMPINLFCERRLPHATVIAAHYRDAVFVIDHLGLHQPVERPAPVQPFADLPTLLDLGRLDNVFVKISGTATLSHGPFPYTDLWGPLGRIFDAFGVDRCLWGTDWTRATAFASYGQAVDSFRDAPQLTDTEKDALMSRTLRRVYGWDTR